MPNESSTHVSEYELEQMRDEIRRLRDEQRQQQDRIAGVEQKALSNGHSNEPRTEEEAHDQDQDQNHEESGPKKISKPHPRRKWIIAGVALVVGVLALLWWLHGRQFESTDDAQVETHLDPVAARVAGTVTWVYVEENQVINAGDPIAELDPRDYKVAVEAARSQLAQAKAQSAAAQPNVPVTQTTTQTGIATAAEDVASAQANVAAANQNYQAALAKVQEAEANNAKAQADVDRYRPLAQKDEVPQQQFDQVTANAKAQAAGVAAAKASAQAAQQQVGQSQAALRAAQQRQQQVQKNAPQEVNIRRADVQARAAAIEAAQAQLDQAELNLSYTKILSPVSGIVAQRIAEVGQHVTPGQQMVVISQTNDLWVTANFKETQIRRMHPQQSVTIHVDALDRDFDGYVESMPGASGAVTSLLPPENATGNFVKVVQRLPVRIRFKQGQQGLDQLRPGMSAEPKVRVG